MKSRSDLIRITTFVVMAGVAANLFDSKAISMQVVVTTSVISILILLGVIGNQIVRTLEDNAKQQVDAAVQHVANKEE